MRTSAPIARPMRCSSSGSKVAPRAMLTGNAVFTPMTHPRGPSLNWMPGMPSRSTTAAGKVRWWYEPAIIANSPGHASRSPSRQSSCSARVICATSWAAASWAVCRPAATSSAAARKAPRSSVIGRPYRSGTCPRFVRESRWSSSGSGGMLTHREQRRCRRTSADATTQRSIVRPDEWDLADGHGERACRAGDHDGLLRARTPAGRRWRRSSSPTRSSPVWR